MKSKMRLTFAPIVFIALTMFIDGAEPPADDVASKVKLLWVGNELVNLKAYLIGVGSDYPDFVPAISSAAFYDSVFCGRLNQSLDKLLRLKKDRDANMKLYPDNFGLLLDMSIKGIQDAIRIQVEHGQSETDWQANANAKEVRDDWQEHLLPILDLVSSSPKIFIQTK